jgi:hypothetical protein
MKEGSKASMGFHSSGIGRLARGNENNAQLNLGSWV